MSATLQRSRSRSGVIPEEDASKPTKMRRGTSFGCGSREDIHNNPDPSLPTQYVRKDSRVKVSEEPPRTIPRTVSKFNAQFGPAPPPPGPAVVQKVTNMRRTRSDPVQLQSRVLPILGVSEESEDSKPIPIKRTVSLAMGFQKIPEDWSALPTISEGVSMGSSELVNRSLKAINNYGDDEILPPPDEEEEISPPQKRVSKPFDASVKVAASKGKEATPYAQKQEEPGRSRLTRTNSRPESNARIQFPPVPPDEPVPPSNDEYNSPHAPDPPSHSQPQKEKKKKSFLSKLFGRGKSQSAAPEKPAGLAKSKTATEGVSRDRKLDDLPRTKTLAEDGTNDGLSKNKSKSFFKKTKSFGSK